MGWATGGEEIHGNSVSSVCQEFFVEAEIVLDVVGNTNVRVFVPGVISGHSRVEFMHAI